MNASLKANARPGARSPVCVCDNGCGDRNALFLFLGHRSWPNVIQPVLVRPSYPLHSVFHIAIPMSFSLLVSLIYIKERNLSSFQALSFFLPLLFPSHVLFISASVSLFPQPGFHTSLLLLTFTSFSELILLSSLSSKVPVLKIMLRLTFLPRGNCVILLLPL